MAQFNCILCDRVAAMEWGGYPTCPDCLPEVRRTTGPAPMSAVLPFRMAHASTDPARAAREIERLTRWGVRRSRVRWWVRDHAGEVLIALGLVLYLALILAARWIPDSWVRP